MGLRGEALRRQAWEAACRLFIYFLLGGSTLASRAAWLVPNCARHSPKRTSPVGLTAAVERGPSALRQAQGPELSRGKGARSGSKDQ